MELLLLNLLVNLVVQAVERVDSPVEHPGVGALKAWGSAGHLREGSPLEECVDYRHRSLATPQATMQQLLSMHLIKLTVRGTGRKAFAITPLDLFRYLQVYPDYPGCFRELVLVLREEQAVVWDLSAVA